MMTFLKKIIAGKCADAVAARLDFAASCRYLAQLGLLENPAAVKMPCCLPQHEDLLHGAVAFYRLRLADTVLDNLTLPRLLVGHCEVEEVSLINTMLAESNWCWNALVNVNFTGADLHGSDLRAGYFTHVDFTRADLRRVDFRHSILEDCTFTGADLAQARITAGVADKLEFTAGQFHSLMLCRQDGPEPQEG